MALGEIDVIEVGRWRTAWSAKERKVVLILEFADRKPLGFAMDVRTAGEMGRALADLDPENAPRG